MNNIRMQYGNLMTFGQSHYFKTGVTDGFMWRENSNQCIAVSSTQLLNMNDGLRQNFQTNPGLQATGTSITTVSNLTQNLNTGFIWSTQADHYVVNPCMLTVTMPTFTYQHEIGDPAVNKALTPSLVNQCPYTTQGTLLFDYSLESVTKTGTSSATTMLASKISPCGSTSCNLQQQMVTDTSFVGSYTAQFKFWMFRDDYSTTFLNAPTSTGSINIVYCTPSVSFLPVLPPQTYNIGSPMLTFDLQSQFTNGNCIYSTSGDPSFIWPSVTTYIQESLTKFYYQVTATPTNPQIQIYTTDQSTHGTHTYRYTYTNYLGVSQIVTQTIKLVQTACIPQVKGLGTLKSTYQRSMLNQTIISIDLSTITNTDCQFSLKFDQESGPLNQTFIVLTQPAFNHFSTFVYKVSTNATLSINAIPGSTLFEFRPYVGIYTFWFKVLDFNTPSTVLAQQLVAVDILDCENKFKDSQNLGTFTVILGNQTIISVPSFVDFACHQVTTSFQEKSGKDLSQAIQIQQDDQIYGNSTLFVQPLDISIRGNYTLNITSKDNINGQIQSHWANITIIHICETTVLIPSDQSDIEIEQTDKPYKIAWSNFIQNVAGCEKIVYDVKFKRISGQVNKDWFTVDADNQIIVLNQLAVLTSPSVVNVIITGQIMGIAWLPSSSTSFNTKIKPSDSNSNTTSATNQTFQFIPNYPTQTTKPTAVQQPLQAIIHSISNTGLVQINFNQKVLVPEMYRNVSQRYKEANYTETVQYLLHLSVKSGTTDADTNRTAIIKYNLTDFQPTYFTIQVDFANPNLITPLFRKPDILVVDFLTSWIFQTSSYSMLANNTQISQSIPSQISQNQAQTLQKLAQSAASGMTSLATLNLIINILLSFGLKYLWNFVNLLQFLIFIRDWQINFPLNSLTILSQLKSIALMEFVDTKAITGKLSAIVGLDPTDPTNIFNRMGMMFLIVFGIAVAIGCLFVVSFFVNQHYWAYKRYRQIQESIFYNAFIRYILQSCLKMGIVAVNTVLTLQWEPVTFPMLTSCFFSIIILTLIGISPVVFALLLKNSFHNLARPSKQKQIGTLYLAIRDTDKFALAYSSVFMTRRILFITLTFGLLTQPMIQIQIFVLMTMAYMTYIGLVTPHTIVLMSSLELINEQVLMIICYHFVLFTGLVSDYETKQTLGWSMSAFIGLLFIINLSVIVNENIKALKLKYKRYKSDQAKKAINLARDQRIETLKKEIEQLQQQQIQKQLQLNKQKSQLESLSSESELESLPVKKTQNYQQKVEFPDQNLIPLKTKDFGRTLQRNNVNKQSFGQPKVLLDGTQVIYRENGQVRLVPDPDNPGTFTLHEDLFDPINLTPTTDYLTQSGHNPTNSFFNQNQLLKPQAPSNPKINPLMQPENQPMTQETFERIVAYQRQQNLKQYGLI